MNISWAGLIFVGLLVALVLAVATFVSLWATLRRQAEQLGYASVGDYLRAVPRTDEEKKRAVDMAFKGLVICLAGLAFPPLLLFGLFPLFYGGRKLVWASMGLGLVDESDQPS